MPSYNTPALFIDFSRLPPPKVIEEIDYEALLQTYKNQVIAKRPELASAVALEQSPTNVILQAEAYGEMMVRARVNDAARAVMLAFAKGSDLDHLASYYNVQRMVIPGEGNAPDTPESDAAFRRRVQMAPESFTTAGSAGAYAFHALSADPLIRDAYPIMTTPGVAQVAIMASGSDPVPTEDQLTKVRSVLNMPRIKPLTDVVSVVPAERIDVAIVADVTLYPGPNATLVMNDINAAIGKVRERIALIGRDLTRSAIITACTHEGVQNVKVTSPAADVVVGPDQVAWITSATINIQPIREE